MVTNYIGNGVYLGLAADTKPTTGVATNAIFITTDKPAIHYYNGSSWVTDIPTLGSANTFTAAQTINAILTVNGINQGYVLTVRRDTNSAGLDVGVGFTELNSSSAAIRYAAFLGGIVSNTATSETGQMKFQVIKTGTLADVLVIDADGIITVGRNKRLKISESGLTAVRTMTFPDFDAKMVGETTTQTLTNKTIDEDSNTVTARQAYTYLVYPFGALNFKVKDKDGNIVYTSNNPTTADALGALQYCRDQLAATSPGGLVQLTEGSFPVSATFSLTGSTHRYQSYQGVNNGSVFGSITEIKALGDFPAVTIDGSSTNAQGHSFRDIYFSHNTAGYTSGLIRLLDQVVECTFDNLSFYDTDRFAGDCFKIEILTTTSLKSQYQNRIRGCTSRGFDNFIHVNNQADEATHGSFISTTNIHDCNVWNAKRVLKVAGVSGAQILDWNFDRVNFQHSASNTVAANEGIFDYDASPSCWQHKHTNCMIWDITSPGINYANVSDSVELSIRECNPSFRIGGSGAYKNKVKVTEYYLGGNHTPLNTGYIVPSNTSALGEGLLVSSTVIQTPSYSQDSISPFLSFFSGTTQGTNTGVRRGPSVYRMEHSPYFEAYAGPNNTSASRCYIGLGTNVAIGDTDTIIGTTDSGIYAGWRPGDTNIQIFHHDGDGTAMTVIDTGLAKTSNMWKCAFLIDSTGFSWLVATVNGSKVGTRVTTQVPATGVSMGMACSAQNTTTTSIGMNIRYVKLVLRNI